MGTRKPSYLSLTDLFCGAGGASIGGEAAGLRLALGINHWQRAIETHSTNFPHAAHDCRDLSETHPSRYGSTHLLWASPECTTHSQARGKKRNSHGQLPISEDWEALPTEAEERSRVTMWDVVRYAEFHHYEAVVVENVEEITAWSLLPDWYHAMETLGYDHRTLHLNSQFFGVPQSRDRWYAVFWKRGNRHPALDYHPTAWCPSCVAVVSAVQAWKPKRSAGRYRQQYIYACPICAKEALPFVQPAAVAIDWSILGERIGDRRKPLAAATMARIQAGIDRYWREAVVLDTLRDPKLRPARHAPLPTQTQRQSLALVAHMRGTHNVALGSSTKPADAPLGAITAGGIHHGVVEHPHALYIKNYGPAEAAGSMAHPVGTDPLGSITAVDHHALLVPTRGPRAHRGGSAQESSQPLPTQLGEVTEALVTQIDMSFRGHASRRVRPASEPIATVTARGGENFALVSSYYKREAARPADEPMGTITNELRHGLVVKAAGSTYDPSTYKRVRDAASDPLWAQTATNETALVEPPAAQLVPYYKTGVSRPVDDPMGTVTTKDRTGLLEGGTDIAIEDCHFRMLVPMEIQRGMAFGDDYLVTGNQRERVQQCGQAVTPPVAEWILARIVESLS